MGRTLRIGVAGIIFAASVSQADVASAPSTNAFDGPAIPGLCILNRTRILTVSKVAVSANTQFAKLRNTAQADVNAAEAKIQSDNKGLQAQAKTLAPQQLQQRQQALASRQLALQNVAAQRNKNLEAVKVDAVSKISAQAQPIIVQSYRAHKCGILFNQEAVLAGPGGLDLTSDVVAQLDKKISTFPLVTPKSPGTAK